jgi:hypothetical protein
MGLKRSDRQNLLLGTLDMIGLKTLSIGALHEYGIAQHIRSMSGEVLHVEEGYRRGSVKERRSPSPQF